MRKMTQEAFDLINKSDDSTRAKVAAARKHVMQFYKEAQDWGAQEHRVAANKHMRKYEAREGNWKYHGHMANAHNSMARYHDTPKMYYAKRETNLGDATDHAMRAGHEANRG